ncbi:Type cbb3 cytochrome oxidase biogenesis protein CcoG, involved in Cu oxidation [hydrothermal vent metagenome]|uniref:Type cbb3 cytochrome oxidase biogenesis protein CcoG, involved in Cu oxidation n=1 Tax=hydrothermal vent metagenome TaxID=652676 RepID=A0A3B1B1K3_9ZZZZ
MVSFSCIAETMASAGSKLQLKRRIFQTGFFILFIFAPILDLFRLDLNLGHFIFFGQNWTLGLEALQAGEGTAAEAVFNIITRAFLPLLGLVLLFGWVSWKYGRLYCGWLCPHFSVVEMINSVMRKASGKFSLWDKKKSLYRVDGSTVKTDKRYWWLVFIAVAGFAFLWAVIFLTYLLPPKEIYYNLAHFSLTRNQMLFIGVATLLLMIEFMFARHFFCRFACAVGVFQSLVWMANKRAMVVSFDRENAAQCQGCYVACEDECPMRLKPRSIKRHMFNCTECARCLDACEQVQFKKNLPALLTWQNGQSALQESDR